MSDASDQPRRGTDGDVVVSLDLYKTVIVSSTLVAVALIILGFLFLDAATNVVQRFLLLGLLVGVVLPAVLYLGYRAVRSGGGLGERIGVAVALFYVSLAGLPGFLGTLLGAPTVLPPVPFVVRDAIAAAPVPDGVLQVTFALIGIALIGAGAGTYILGTRFRTAGMGNPKDDGD
ncbi:DUF7315 family membrane protein [Halomarina ordinaria]|uniref:DUF7315 domain-containing protein n=1 Tax=Halomarina ordinaria TaxID=3033939 RepID=A0ABD5UC91_9EURY|nr:hypothetical protein [Halomarina sp. PSRA2]